MKVAIPHWQGRVSPVFDVAGNLLLIEVNNGQEQTRQNIALPDHDTLARVKLLAESQTHTLICGAISRPLELALTTAGIEVIAHICGDIECVITAYLKCQLQQNQFLMPGCCGRQRRRRMGQRHQTNGRFKQ